MTNPAKIICTPDDILAYARVCLEIQTLLKRLEDDGWLNIIVPSRGAYPFYNLAMMSNIEDFRNGKLPYPPLLKQRLFLMPFTSDSIRVEQSSLILRKFWCKVTSDFILNRKSIYSDYYKILVKFVGKQVLKLPTDNLLPSRLADTKKFIFIDTVISGRAAFEILSSFEDIGCDQYHAILIIDNNGEKLEETYKAFFEEDKRRGKISMFYIKNIFSEDASPLLNGGIASVVFPTLIEQCYNEVKEFRNDENAAAGLWVNDILVPFRDTEINRVRGIVNPMITTTMTYLKDNRLKSSFEILIHKSLELLHKENALKHLTRSQTKMIAQTRFSNIKGTTVNVTNSHVIRMDLPDAVLRAFSKKINTL